MESQPKFRPNQDLELRNQVREVLRYHHYAYRTETYCQWILRYIRFYDGNTHPRELTFRDVKHFLSDDLAVRCEVSASTQRQTLNALVSLYRNVLDLSLEEEFQPVRSKKQPG